MSITYLPITVTVRRGELDLFDVDCEVCVDYDAPDGQNAPNWDVLSFHFDGPGQRLSVRIHRRDPLFAVLYENLPHYYINRRLSEMLEDE